MNRIEKYYNNHPLKEQSRLSRRAYDTIESEITRKFLTKHLKPNSRIAEIGCGAGHYSTWLLSNHQVHLVDLSSELLKLAKIEIDKLNLQKNVLGISNLNACNLSELAENIFDVTLVMGPLYHLIHLQDREQCLKEAYRITKPGGLVFSATINRACPFLAMMHDSPESLVSELSEDTEEMNRILNVGQYENLDENPNAFTDAYFANVNEIPEIYKRINMELVDSFACEGLASYLYDKAEVIKKNPKAWSRFLEIIYENSTKSSSENSGQRFDLVL